MRGRRELREACVACCQGPGLPGLARRNLVGFGESWPESMSGTQSSGPRMRSAAWVSGPGRQTPSPAQPIFPIPDLRDTQASDDMLHSV